MAATGQISSTCSTPSVFNFLKEGLLLPTHNRRLFATIFTIIVASSCLLRLSNNLAVQPLTDEIRLETRALNSTDPSNPAENLQLTQKTLDVTWALLLTRLFGVNVIIKSAIQIVVLLAAITTYSGELHTSGSLLAKIKRQLKGPVLTLALVHALEVAYDTLILGATGRLLVFPMTMKYFWLSIVVLLLVLVVDPFFRLVFCWFLFTLSMVVAVAEPGCYGTGALGRAWQLVKGKRGRALLFISVSAALSAALTLFYILDKRCELTSMAAGGLLLGFLDSILTSAVQLFEACAMAAFYYECKGSTKASEFLPIRSKFIID